MRATVNNRGLEEWVPVSPWSSPESTFCELARTALQSMVAMSLDVESSKFLEDAAAVDRGAGSPRLTRNGYLPKRAITTSLGDVVVRVPRVREHDANGASPRRQFTSEIVAPYRRMIEADRRVLSWLMYSAIAKGRSDELFNVIFGADEMGCAAAVMDAIGARWQRWRALFDSRDLSSKRFVRCWFGGFWDPRIDYRDVGVLVVAGLDAEGSLTLIANSAGKPTDPRDWAGLMAGLKRRGFVVPARSRGHQLPHDTLASILGR